VKITTSIILPAAMKSYFDSCLLATPPCKFGEDSEELEIAIYYIEHKLMKKLFRAPGEHAKWIRKIEKAKSLLQAIQAEENALKSKNSKQLLRTRYYFALPPIRDGKISRGFTWWGRAKRFWKLAHAH
jgi:hypothetical protein